MSTLDDRTADALRSLADQIGELTTERAALKNNVAFFRDAAAKFCTDLAFVEAQRDALLAARVPMTQAQINRIFNANDDAAGFARDIEAFHHIGNQNEYEKCP